VSEHLSCVSNKVKCQKSFIAKLKFFVIFKRIDIKPGNLNELVKTISLLGKSHISFPMKNLIIKVAT